MCEKAFEKNPWLLKYIPGCHKTKEMCNEAVQKILLLLKLIPDWFVTQQQIKLWHDDDYWYHDDEMIKWYKGYKKRKAQKASIKKELMPIAWHPSRCYDWCVSEDEKKETEKLWG